MPGYKIPFYELLWGRSHSYPLQHVCVHIWATAISLGWPPELDDWLLYYQKYHTLISTHKESCYNWAGRFPVPAFTVLKGKEKSTVWSSVVFWGYQPANQDVPTGTIVAWQLGDDQLLSDTVSQAKSSWLGRSQAVRKNLLLVFAKWARHPTAFYTQTSFCREWRRLAYRS